MSINRVKLVRAVTVSQSVGFYIPIVEDLKQKGYEIISVSSPGPELQEVRDLGIRAIEVPMERRISPFKDLFSLFMLVNVFRKEKTFYGPFNDTQGGNALHVSCLADEDSS
mgnify:CR=1 FL=1